MGEADKAPSERDRATAKAIAEHAVARVTKQAPSYLQETAVADLMRADPKAVDLAITEVSNPTMNEEFAGLNLADSDRDKAVGLIRRLKESTFLKDSTDYTRKEIIGSAYGCANDNGQQAFYANLLHELVTANRPLAEKAGTEIEIDFKRAKKKTHSHGIYEAMSKAIQHELKITGGQNVGGEEKPLLLPNGVKQSLRTPKI